VTHLDMPATPARIWQAIEAARLRSGGVGDTAFKAHSAN
jgi:hypothetical protein